MATTRRQFIKRGLGAVTVSVVVPKLGLLKALGQETAARLDRKLVVIQFGGGNDGLNTIIPYSDARYLSLRPTLSFKDTELVDSGGVSTMINSDLAFHPAMKEIRDLYQQSKVAIILGVGEPGQSTSHFTGTTNIASGRTDVRCLMDGSARTRSRRSAVRRTLWRRQSAVRFLRCSTRTT